MPKDEFLKLQNRLYSENKGSNNIVSGFRRTGLFPVNLGKPKEGLLGSASNRENIKDSASHAVVDILQDIEGKNNPPTSK